MKLTKYQLLKIKVENPGQTVKFSADTDKQYAKVQGCYVSLPNDNSHFGTTLEMKIADQEIFPEGFETKLLACSQSSSPNERFFLFDKDENVDAAGSRVDIRYTDGGYSTGVNFPYTAVIYLKLKNH